MIRSVRSCWPIVNTLLTSQYSTSPAGKLMNMKPKMNGMNMNIRLCAGSAVCGAIRCCSTIEAVIRIGVM